MVDRVTKKMEKMVGFRNIAVHDYEEIDKDLEDFYSVILYSPLKAV
jgi:uncharacterized protein YutE (UPF0331/DUF86 family)